MSINKIYTSNIFILTRIFTNIKDKIVIIFKYQVVHEKYYCELDYTQLWPGNVLLISHIFLL